MVNNKKTFIAALMATTLFTAGAAWAAGQHMADQQKSTPQQTAADKNFGKLSADGSRAFEDLTLTRLAIYDGRIADAKKYVNEADTAFGKAKTDEAVFTKAQADLKTPPPKRRPPTERERGGADDRCRGREDCWRAEWNAQRNGRSEKADRMVAD